MLISESSYRIVVNTQSYTDSIRHVLGDQLMNPIDSTDWGDSMQINDSIFRLDGADGSVIGRDVKAVVKNTVFSRSSSAFPDALFKIKE